METVEIKAPTKEKVEELAKEGYSQVCIWPGTIVVEENDNPTEKIADFENWLKEEFDVRGKYLEEVKTLPDETGPGGRNDLFFAVHTDDIEKFAVQRLRMGIRWYEDVVYYNGHANLYSKEILGKYIVRW